MKRTLLLLAVLALAASLAEAKGFYAGVKGGIYSANTTEVPRGWTGTSWNAGFAGGACVGYAFNDNLSLQPEFLYVRKGPNGTALGFPPVTFTSNITYLEMPVLLVYKVRSRGNLSPYVIMGPGIGINLSAEAEVEMSNPVTHRMSTGTLDYANVVNETEFIFVFGGGLLYGVGPGRVTLDGRFDLGVTKTYSDGRVTGDLEGEEISTYVYAGDTKNIGFGLMLGYTIPF